ncbi:hypothetical protein GYMLUDRAFT_1026964 [Collybiopsis luxurians FD-317 M1]|uniref:Uncharacterized protein n=1 Tax=Collybiopsis luxurians FD-317 M1 TaxID=944289 RepID=A0A0D0C5Q3_9AGAR|nr:hypothetical protein GYMLUDRAFT_1026964 [Collybiopsis luxurians FD-317 M1]
MSTPTPAPASKDPTPVLDTESNASKTVVKVNNILATVQTDLLVVQQPLSEAVIIMSKVDDCVTVILKGTKALDWILNTLRSVLRLAKYLGRLIPEVGPIISQVASTIEQFKIESTVQKVIETINSIVKKAQDGVISKINKIITSVSGHLDSLTSKIPVWQHTLLVLGNMFMLLDAVISVVGNQDGMRDLVKNVYQTLDNLSGGMLSQMTDLFASLNPLKDFIQNAWKEFRESVVKTLQEAFGDILSVLSGLSKALDKFESVLTMIEDRFKPLLCIVEFISWISEQTIGRLVDMIVNAVGIHKLVDSIIGELMKLVGMDEFKKKVEDFFVGNISRCCDALEKSVNGDKSIYSTIPMASIYHPLSQVDILMSVFLQFAQTMSNYSKDPTNAILDVVTTGKFFLRLIACSYLYSSLSSHYRENILEAFQQPARPPEPSHPLPSLFPSMPAEQAVVNRCQAIDKFVMRTSRSLQVIKPPMEATPVSRTTPMTGLASMAFLTVLPEMHTQMPIESDIPSEQGSFAPKLSYATYQDQSLSVLIRTLHPRIIDNFSAYASSTLPELTATTSKPSNTMARTSAFAARPRLPAALPAEPALASAQLGPIFVKSLENKGQSFKVSASTMHVPGGATTAVTDTGAMYPGFAKFKDIVAKLKLSTDSAEDSFNTIRPALTQADNIFGAFDPRSTEFVDHLIHMLNGLDPLLEFISHFMKLLLSYQKPLTQSLVKLLDEPGIAKVVDVMFEIVTRLYGSVDLFQNHRNTLLEEITMFKNTYTSFGMFAQKICSSIPDSQTLGPTVTNLMSFILTVSSRSQTALYSFDQAVVMAESIFDYHLEKPDPELLKQLDATCAKLADAAQTTLEGVQKIPEKVVALHAALKNLYSDLQSYYIPLQAAGKISSCCKDAEVKLIAADHVGDFCHRINVFFAPFRSMLDSLGYVGSTEGVISKDALPNIELILKGGFSNFTVHQWLTATIPAAQGLDLMAEKYFNFEGIKANLHDCLEAHVKQHLEEYNKAVEALFVSGDSQKTFIYSPDNGKTNVQVRNPLFDESTSAQLASILSTFTSLAQNGGSPPQSAGEVLNPNERRIPLWRAVEDPTMIPPVL